MKPINKNFFRQDTIKIAREILGKMLVIENESERKAGMIVEAEAYRGKEDLACHASWRKRESCEALYFEGGFIYVYLTYGIHYMLNIVTENAEYPSAILIRALEPIENIAGPTNGPGRLTKTLQIDKRYSGKEINKCGLIIEEGNNFKDSEIVVTTRVGIDYAKEWKDMPWRFYVKGNTYVSKR